MPKWAKQNTNTHTHTHIGFTHRVERAKKESTEQQHQRRREPSHAHFTALVRRQLCAQRSDSHGKDIPTSCVLWSFSLAKRLGLGGFRCPEKKKSDRRHGRCCCNFVSIPQHIFPVFGANFAHRDATGMRKPPFRSMSYDSSRVPVVCAMSAREDVHGERPGARVRFCTGVSSKYRIFVSIGHRTVG